ncbi:MAG: hypothetical protein ACRBCT_01855 [Alphaproteobacteria bacterium]
MHIEKSRYGMERKRFSTLMPVKNGEAIEAGQRQTEQGISPISRIDPDLRQTLLLEALIRRMERIEDLQEKAMLLEVANELTGGTTPQRRPAPTNPWLNAPIAEQDIAPTPKPDAKTAAAKYRQVGEF